jgi:glutathione S-transferase
MSLDTSTSLQLLVYGSPISNFVRKVQLLLEFKGVPYRIEMPDREALLKLSPLGKVPMLRDGNNLIRDSSVICDYLERRFPQYPVYPVDPAARAEALWLEEYSDVALNEPAFALAREAFYKPAFYGQATDTAALEQARAMLGDRLDYLEQVLHGKFLVGTQLSIADLAVAAELTNPILLGFEVDAGRWPKLSAYLKDLLAHEPFASRIRDTRQAMAAHQAR